MKGKEGREFRDKVVEMEDTQKKKHNKGITRAP